MICATHHAPICTMQTSFRKDKTYGMVMLVQVLFHDWSPAFPHSVCVFDPRRIHLENVLLLRRDRQNYFTEYIFYCNSVLMQPTRTITKKKHDDIVHERRVFLAVGVTIMTLERVTSQEFFPATIAREKNTPPVEAGVTRETFHSVQSKGQ